ncbi:hypothetical protein ACWC9T_35175 [Kitasatospora sp. NPDC001159]
MKTIKKAALGTVAALALAIGVAGTGTANADAPAGSSILYPGQCLSQNHYIQAGNTQLTFQNDRNIVVSYAGSPTYQFPGTLYQAQQLCMQTDGNLVAYDTANRSGAWTARAAATTTPAASWPCRPTATWSSTRTTATARRSGRPTPTAKASQRPDLGAVIRTA